MFKPRRPRFWLVLLFVLYVAAGIVASITIGRPDAAIAILAFIAATIAAGFWLMRRVGPMLVLVILMVAQQASADTFSLVAGVFVDKEIGTAAVPYASGTWGTDYLTSAHVMRMGAAYRVTWDGKTFDDADIVPWPGLHRGTVPIRFLHANFREWVGQHAAWPPELDHALVAEGWPGQAFPTPPGCVKGVSTVSTRVPCGWNVWMEREQRHFAIAEPSARITACFMGYSPPE